MSDECRCEYLSEECGGSDVVCQHCYDNAMNKSRDLERRLADAIRERDRLADRERSIIIACERVADGGQYRADIVSAIDRIRCERDDARAALREMLEGMSGTYAVDCVDYKANDIKRWRKAAGLEDGQ